MRAIIVFTDLDPLPADAPRIGRVLRWFLARLKPGFRHCLVVVPHPSGGLTLLDPTMTGLRVFQLPGDGYLADLAMGEALGRCRMLVVDLKDQGWDLRLGSVTCVGFIRNLLGLKRRRIVLTPWQLYRELHRDLQLEGST